MEEIGKDSKPGHCQTPALHGVGAISGLNLPQSFLKDQREAPEVRWLESWWRAPSGGSSKHVIKDAGETEGPAQPPPSSTGRRKPGLGGPMASLEPKHPRIPQQKGDTPEPQGNETPESPLRELSPNPSASGAPALCWGVLCSPSLTFKNVFISSLP